MVKRLHINSSQGVHLHLLKFALLFYSKVTFELKNSMSNFTLFFPFPSNRHKYGFGLLLHVHRKINMSVNKFKKIFSLNGFNYPEQCNRSVMVSRHMNSNMGRAATSNFLKCTLFTFKVIVESKKGIHVLKFTFFRSMSQFEIHKCSNPWLPAE